MVRTPLTHGEIVRALERARKAFTTNQTEAADLSPLSYETVRKYENENDKKGLNWIKPIQYVAWLAALTEKSRIEIMTLLGVPIRGAITEPELSDYVTGLVKNWEDVRMRKKIRGAMQALGIEAGEAQEPEASGREESAAAAHASRAGS